MSGLINTEPLLHACPRRRLDPQRSPWSLLLISGLTLSPSFLAPESTPRAHHPFLGANQLLSKPSPRPARRLPQPPDLWPRRQPGCFVCVTSSSRTFPSLVTDGGPQRTGEGIPAPDKPPSPGAFPTQHICPPEPLRAHCRSAHTRHLERATQPDACAAAHPILWRKWKAVHRRAIHTHNFKVSSSHGKKVRRNR